MRSLFLAEMTSMGNLRLERRGRSFRSNPYMERGRTVPLFLLKSKTPES